MSVRKVQALFFQYWNLNSMGSILFYIPLIFMFLEA
jgi:hypothetical protein